jgi:hypothetical protein
MNGRVIWCLGMYASASTWIFNVVREIFLTKGEANLSVQFVCDRVDLDKIYQNNMVHIIKSHEISKEAVLLMIAGRADNILITLREPHDATASMMEYRRYDFHRALDLVAASSNLCSMYMKDRRSNLFHYDTRFFDHPETVWSVAKLLGIAISETAARDIFDRLSRSAVEKFIERLPRLRGVLQDRVSGDFLDPQTQWHTHHHGRTGESGRWRNSLSVAEANEVTARFKDWPANHSKYDWTG